MKIENNEEFFVVIHKIIKVLRDNGESELAEDLDDAQSISSMPGEIFGEVRVSLRKIPSEIVSKLNLTDDVKECLEGLDEALDSE